MQDHPKAKHLTWMISSCTRWFVRRHDDHCFICCNGLHKSHIICLQHITNQTVSLFDVRFDCIALCDERWTMTIGHRVCSMKTEASDVELDVCDPQWMMMTIMSMIRWIASGLSQLFSIDLENLHSDTVSQFWWTEWVCCLLRSCMSVWKSKSKHCSQSFRLKAKCENELFDHIYQQFTEPANDKNRQQTDIRSIELHHDYFVEMISIRVGW